MSESVLNLDELPRNWAWARIIDVLLAFESGGRPKGGVRDIKNGVPSIGGEHILYNGKFDFSKVRYIPFDYYENLNRGKIEKNDILVVKDGATTGKTGFISETYIFEKSAVNEHVFILRVMNELMSPKYLFFWMQSNFGQKYVKLNFKGTAQGGINTSFASNSFVPIAPLPEQHRIVARIEELFSRLDAGVEALQREKALLHRYRQSVLQAAVEGKLSEEWRKMHPNEGASVPHIVSSSLNEEESAIPNNWIWTSFSSLLIEPLRNGHSAKESANGRGIRTLKLTAVTERQFSEKNSKITVADPKRVKNLWLKKNDILIERANTIDYVGLSAIYLGADDYAIFPDLLIRARVSPSYISPTFADIVLRTPHSRDYFMKNAQGISGNMPKIDQGTIEQLQIPLPPLNEQYYIIDEFERRMSISDNLEAAIDNDISRTKRLRQSVLKTAFEGKLVPQDPNDEPASLLLERIRTERIKQTPTRGRKSNNNGRQMRLFQ